MVALWAVIAYFLWLQVPRSSSSECQRVDIVHGVKVTSGVDRVDRGVSLYRCIAHCQMTITCKSINYHTESKTCGLFDTSAPGLTSNEDYIFVKIVLFRKSLAGGCSKLRCKSGAKCIVDRLHRASCVAESTRPTPTPTKRCGNPQEHDNATVTVMGHDVGDVATYNCTTGHMMCGAHQVRCQATGAWTRSDFRCQSDYVPVVEWMAACLLTRGSSVVLTAITPRMGVLIIEIESQNTVNNRLEMNLVTGHATWSRGGGITWSVPEMYSFQKETFITLNITLTINRIEVRTNGKLHPSARGGLFEEAYSINIRSSEDTEAIRVGNCCL
ncbi:uncharacterized protein [Haliotis asinina]|uniref:uncharacterized protein n=1 Tax=Haliotis asinina TaxID=109174 RepID=UPI003531E612